MRGYIVDKGGGEGGGVVGGGRFGIWVLGFGNWDLGFGTWDLGGLGKGGWLGLRVEGSEQLVGIFILMEGLGR